MNIEIIKGELDQLKDELQVTKPAHKNLTALLDMLEKQLMLGGVVSSSDLIVVELSDDELKIITIAELKQWKQSAIEFDGFEGWIVRGRLI
jgi:hypothetical protein